MIGKRKRPDHIQALGHGVKVVRRKYLDRSDQTETQPRGAEEKADQERHEDIEKERSRMALRKFFENEFGVLPGLGPGKTDSAEEDEDYEWDDDGHESSEDGHGFEADGREDGQRPHIRRKTRRAAIIREDGLEDDVPASLDEASGSGSGSEDDFESEDESESAWSGLSDDQQGRNQVAVPVVQVVDYRSTGQTDPSVDMVSQKSEYKSFMSSAPPRDRTTVSTSKSSKKSVTNDPEDPIDSLNLKNDLDLQRLLRESHLLEKSSLSSTTPSFLLEGNQRHKATDLRIQSLGSKHSTFTQEKMPLAHRKGIVEKKTYREELRRKEARENGIVLERATTGKKIGDRERKREKGVDLPGVGKFSGGMLKLNKKDLRDIQGPTKRTVARGGGRAGRRGGGKKRGRR